MAQNNAVKVLDRPEASALGEMVHAELSQQIATAKSHPRNEDAALNLLATLACRNDAVAEACMYTLKRKDKDGGVNWITGPSVRFAELLNYCWGNTRAGARIIDDTGKAVIAQGIAYDLQRNTGLLLEVRRSVTTSSGARFSADMVNVTSNAACSIALRNAIFDCIPQILWWDIYEQVKTRAVGAAQIPERIQKAVKFFVSQGAKQEDILRSLAVKKVEDMGRTHLEILIGLNTALKEGTIKADTIFTEEGAAEREKLRLTADDGDDQPMTSVDKLLNKAGGPSGDKAAAGSGDGGGVAKSGDGKKGKAAAKKADTAGAQGGTATDPSQGQGKTDGSQTPHTGEKTAEAVSDQSATDEADADREDADLVARVEADVKAAAPTARSQPIRDNRGALQRIEETHPDEAIRKRAHTLLNRFDLDA